MLAVILSRSFVEIILQELHVARYVVIVLSRCSRAQHIENGILAIAIKIMKRVLRAFTRNVGTIFKSNYIKNP